MPTSSDEPAEGDEEGPIQEQATQIVGRVGTPLPRWF
jgi:hypothetical protein